MTPRRRSVLLLVCCAVLVVGVALQRIRAARGPDGILPGEFERQEALLLAWDSDLAAEQHAILRQVATHACPNVKIVVLVPDASTRVTAGRQLAAAGVPADRLSFRVVPLTQPWVRDFGPLVVKGSDGQPTAVDPHVSGDSTNDAVPSGFARLSNMRTVQPSFSMEGGNLLSNGAGLGVTTNRMLYQNLTIHGLSEAEVSALLWRHFGCREVVYLEQLDGEPTGHVDMFVTFTAIDTVVVGSCSFDEDPDNAEILDRNAERLAGVMTAGGPLKVYRIPMPRYLPDKWPSYTNVVYANGTLLVPKYEGVAPEEEASAVALYRELLPGWQIVTIDSSALIVNDGALHCATNNVYRLPPQATRQVAEVADESPRQPSPAVPVAQQD